MIPANLKEKADELISSAHPLFKAVYTVIPTWANLYDVAQTASDKKVSFDIYKFIVEEDTEDSKKAYYIDAKYNYGVCFLSGLGCDKNPELAFKMFDENKHECPYSMHNFGYCLMYGVGCEKNEQEAIKVWKKNSLKHEPSAKNYQRYIDTQNQNKRQKRE